MCWRAGIHVGGERGWWCHGDGGRMWAGGWEGRCWWWSRVGRRTGGQVLVVVVCRQENGRAGVGGGHLWMKDGKAGIGGGRRMWAGG